MPETNEEIIAFAKKRSPFNHPSVMYKKSKVIDAGFYEDYRYFEDYNLWVTMLNMGFKAYNIQENLVYMRAGEELYKRRGGFRYVGHIFRFQKNMKRIGFIGFREFISNLLVRGTVSLIPNKMRGLMYKKVLRS